jgi:hypothetical protein
MSSPVLTVLRLLHVHKFIALLVGSYALSHVYLCMFYLDLSPTLLQHFSLELS